MSPLSAAAPPSSSSRRTTARRSSPPSSHPRRGTCTDPRPRRKRARHHRTLRLPRLVAHAHGPDRSAPPEPKPQRGLRRPSRAPRVVRAYRWNNGTKMMDQLAPATLPHILHTGNNLLNSDNASSQEVGEILYLILKVYKTSMHTELTKHQQSHESIVPWGTSYSTSSKSRSTPQRSPPTTTHARWLRGGRPKSGPSTRSTSSSRATATPPSCPRT